MRPQLLVVVAVFACEPIATEIDVDAVDIEPDAAPHDASTPDAARVDVDAVDIAPDAALPDVATPDAAVVDVDAVNIAPDAAAVDVDAVNIAPDAALPDVAIPDAAVVDVDAVDIEPDAAPPPPPPCADPAACGDVSPEGVREHHMGVLDGCAFALRQALDIEWSLEVMDEVAEAASGYVPFTEVRLNREGRGGITMGAAERLRNHPHQGFRWNDGDMDTRSWYPQGMTGISDAQAGPAARRWGLVSWYDARDVVPAKGVRVSLADMTDLDEVRYRHLLLVVPARTHDGDPTFVAVNHPNGGAVHGGGIVWWGDLLYVADTTVGFRVFDLSRVVEVSDTDDTDRIGVSPGRVDAHGYRYIVPQVAQYRLTQESCSIRFSFVGLDRSEDPPVMVSGEYHRNDSDGRLARWPLAPDGWLRAHEGTAFAQDAFAAAQTRMQGALSWGGDFYVSSSSQIGNLGRLYRTRPGLESVISAWPYGCEDLYYERSVNRIWTATEHPGNREVVSILLLPPD